MKKISIIIFLLSLTLIFRFLFAYHLRHVYKNGEQVSWNTLLLSDVDSSGGNPKFTAILPNSFPPQRVSVYLLPQTTVHYGQTIHISGKIKARVLNDRSISMTIRSPKITLIHSISDYLLWPLYYIRQKILHMFQMTLSDTDSSLLLGIVFGIKANMPTTFAQQIQATGVTHVIAASGMNVTMVAGFLIWLFGKYFPRRVAVGLSIVGLGLYAVFAGLQSSILRATIMGVCAFSAQLFGRQYHGIYMLFLTAFVMLMLSPQAVFDVGFQLSFLSTVGIMFVQPLIAHKNLFSEDLATTISAQIATVPVLLSSFGQYSLLSVVVNGLVLWTIPPLMILGSAAAMIGLVVPFLGQIFLYLAVPLLWFFEAVVGFFAGFGWNLELKALSPFVSIGYYLLVGSVISIIVQMRHRKQDPAGRTIS